MRRLNGWQRIWVVLSVLSGLAAVGAVVISTSDSNRPEDEAYYLEKLKDDVTIAEIESVGEVGFPSQLSSTEIQHIVKDSMSKNPPDVKEAAAKELRKRAVLHAARARLDNNEARSRNLDLYRFLVALWLSFVVGSYAVGWSIGWVRRGFKAT